LLQHNRNSGLTEYLWIVVAVSPASILLSTLKLNDREGGNVMDKNQGKLNKEKSKIRWRRKFLGGFLLASGTLLALSMTQVANAAEPFILSSPAFKDGTPLAKKNSGDRKGQPELCR